MAAFVNEEMWYVDGVPLSTWAYNIESIGGRQGIPTLAGDNFQVPYRPGEVWRSKMPAARTLSLGMWIRSTDANGLTSKLSTGRRAQFNENFRYLKQVFYNRDRLLTLTKNVRYYTGIQAFTTQVECISDLEPVMAGPNFGKMVVDFRMVDPYWTTGPITVPLAGSLTNPGDDSTHKMVITVNQGVNGQPQYGYGSTVISNNAFSPPLVLNLGAISAGQFWTVDVDNFFLGRSGDPTTNYQNNLTRSGPSPFWMEFKRGINPITVVNRYGDGSFGNISSSVTFYPLYI